jgi:hypothetical protein
VASVKSVVVVIQADAELCFGAMVCDETVLLCSVGSKQRTV